MERKCLGLRAEEVLGSSFEALDIGFPVHQLRDTLAAVQIGREEQAEKVLEGVDRRGRRILCRVRVSGQFDEQGDNHGLVLVFQDITEERAQEEHARYLGRILGQALSEIYFLDPETLRFTLTNEGARKKLGYSETELAQMTLPDVIPGTGADQVRAVLEPLFSGAEKEIVFETDLRTAEGRDYPVEICVQHLAEENPPILVASVHETSGRKQLAGA